MSVSFACRRRRGVISGPCVAWQTKSLKQELQRCQRAMKASSEREAALEARLEERERERDITVRVAQAFEGQTPVSGLAFLCSQRSTSQNQLRGSLLFM